LTVPQYTRIFRMDKLPSFCVIDECLRALQKHWENIEKFESCPVRYKTLVFPVLSHFWPIALAPGESSCESLESSAKPRFSRENRLFCRGGAGFELGKFESY
jgi:hypothetical protein